MSAGEASLGNLHVMLGCVETGANSADHLPVNHDRKSALHLDETTRGDCCNFGPWLIASSNASLGFLNNAAVRALSGASSTLAIKAALSIRT